jgi:lantibiotic leader peptide-processing serine protease
MVFRNCALAAAAVLALSACSDEPTVPVAGGAPSTARRASQVSSYIVMARGDHQLKALEARLRSAGGTVTRTVPGTGLALVRATDAGFARRAATLNGVEAVVPNVRVKLFSPPPRALPRVKLPQVIDNPPVTAPVPDPFVALLWNMSAIDATSAWATSNHGQGARVAVLDTKVDATHPDLAPNVNTTLSRSFNGEPWATTAPGDHGTHVAGIIGAAINALGVVGVAPEAELVSVAITDSAGNADLFWIAQGIVYAADIDADVINMSVGFYVRRNGLIDVNGTPTDPSDDIRVGANELAAFIKVFQRAATYARQQGSTIIASAGNESFDFNHDGAAWVHIPSSLPNVLSISATGPIGWAVRPNVELDTPAFYTNFGQKEIDLAAPGGNLDASLLVEPLPVCAVAGIPAPCVVFDWVLSTVPGGWGWTLGTSMAAPHASGVAALIVAKHGGSLKPARVRAELRATADDLGKPGKDAFYGHGRVNALRAAQ